MASWHPHDEAWDGVERRQESAQGLCSCGRQYDTPLHERYGVCESCDLEQEATAYGDTASGSYADEQPWQEAASDPTGYAMLMHEEAYERAHPTHACDDDRWCPEFGCRACDETKKDGTVKGHRTDLDAPLRAGDVLDQLMRYEQHEATPEEVLRGIWDLVEAAAIIPITKEAN